MGELCGAGSRSCGSRMHESGNGANAAITSARKECGGGLGYLNLLVLLFAWNAMKCAWMAVLSPLPWLSGIRRRAA
jgi:hypothetical protein